MSVTARTAVELKDEILRRLGAPVINIEVTEDQIFDCINRAIELFVEYHYDGVDKSYICRLLTEEEASSRLITFNEPVLAVTKLDKGSSDIFGAYNGAGFVTDWILGLAGAGQGVSHGYGGGIGFGNSFDMTTFQIMRSYWETLRAIVDPTPNYNYNSNARQLRVFDDVKAGTILLIECYVQTALSIKDSAGTVNGDITNYVGSSQDFAYQAHPIVAGGVGKEQFQNVYNSRWVKDYSVELVKQLWGSILKKFQGQQLPGGIAADGQSMYQESTERILELRRELYDIEEPLGVFMG